MKLGLQSLGMDSFISTLFTGGGVPPPSSFAPYAAPSGLKWAFVYETTEGGEQVYQAANDPLIELVAA